MARVFLSYARDDADRAKQVAGALTDAGHEVWWDWNIRGGTRFATEIARALKAADAVIVLWSEAACESAWVQDEAAEGRDSGRLVPVVLDSAKPPLGFRQYQVVDLSAWPNDGAAGFKSLLNSIEALAAPEPAERKPAKPGSKGRFSICVLPFSNMSGDEEQEYFSDGITEDIITDLSKISALSVVARNTAFTYKGKAVKVPDVVRELGITHVLEGSVRKSGGRVRITAQLIDGAGGDHLWADRYDRDLTDIFGIQDEISKSIVEALRLKLLPREQQAIENRGTNNAEAYDLYLMARQYWISGNDGDKRRDEILLRLCRSALDLDPNYARAWALMALTQSAMHRRDVSVTETGLEAAAKALELDPGLAEPHCVKADNFAQQGQFDMANKEIEIALEIDPDSWEVNKEAGLVSYRQGRMAEAMERFGKAASLMDADYRSAGLVASCARGLGDDEAARQAALMTVERAERALSQDRSNGAALAYGAMALAELGERDRATEWMRRALLVDPGNVIMRYNLACMASQLLDDPDLALELVDEFMARARPYQIKHIENDPDMMKLRDDPRFQAMTSKAKKRLGMAPGNSPS